MPGAGIRPDNLKQLMQLTGATEFHTTAKSIFKSEMVFKDVRTELYEEGFLTEQTDIETVKVLVAILNLHQMKSV